MNAPALYVRCFPRPDIHFLQQQFQQAVTLRIASYVSPAQPSLSEKTASKTALSWRQPLSHPGYSLSPWSIRPWGTLNNGNKKPIPAPLLITTLRARWCSRLPSRSLCCPSLLRAHSTAAMALHHLPRVPVPQPVQLPALRRQTQMR